MKDQTTELLAAMINYKPTLADLPVRRRREYNAAVVGKHRAAVAQERAAGLRRHSKANVAEELASAALALLESGGPGSDAIEQRLLDDFPDAGDVGSIVRKLRPRQRKSS